MGADVARSGGTVSCSFTKGVERLIETLMARVEGENQQESLRILSSIAGAMLIARALDNPELSGQFLQSVINARPSASGEERQADVPN